MRNGTQEELDAAKDDATLLPFDAKYILNQDKRRSKDIARLCNVERGDIVWRVADDLDRSDSVRVDNSIGGNGYFVAAYELKVIA